MFMIQVYPSYNGGGGVLKSKPEITGRSETISYRRHHTQTKRRKWRAGQQDIDRQSKGWEGRVVCSSQTCFLKGLPLKLLFG